LTINVDLAEPILASDVYSTPKNTNLATGNLKKVYDVDGTIYPITQPGPLANDLFPNGVGIEPAFPQIWVSNGPFHGQLLSTFSTDWRSVGGGGFWTDSSGRLVRGIPDRGFPVQTGPGIRRMG
jgi:hypothetical protein